MNQPLLLDLFCGAGGAGEGYARAGYRVVGCDIDPKASRHYPYEHYEGDALYALDALASGGAWHGYRLRDFAAIHASPPCQFASQARFIQGKSHPDLLTPTRERLQRMGAIAWVIENVSGARMPHFVGLCGTHFGLRVYRHRQFEASHMLFAPGPCKHPRYLLPGYVCVAGGKAKGHQTGTHGNIFAHVTPQQARAAMGISWASLLELSQAIPPAYTEFIGRQLLSAYPEGAIA